MSLIRSLMRFRNKKRITSQSRNRVFFESLEPRLLLDGTPTVEWYVLTTDAGGVNGHCLYMPITARSNQNPIIGTTT